MSAENSIDTYDRHDSLRANALAMAIDFHRHNAAIDKDEIVTTAMKFYNFLKGNTNANV